MNGVYLQEVDDQKDLGVILWNTLTPTKHIQDVVKKACQKIAMFRRCFTGFDEEKVTILYKFLVHPALEYASSVWSPLTKENMTLKKVQKRHLLLCKDDIDIESLQERRLRTDLGEAYKFINELYKTQAEKFFSLPHKDLRGHSKKLFVRCSRTKLAGHFCNIKW